MDKNWESENLGLWPPIFWMTWTIQWITSVLWTSVSLSLQWLSRATCLWMSLRICQSTSHLCYHVHQSLCFKLSLSGLLSAVFQRLPLLSCLNYHLYPCNSYICVCIHIHSISDLSTRNLYSSVLPSFVKTFLIQILWNLFFLATLDMSQFWI